LQFEKRLETIRHKTGEAEKNKTVALGTSKVRLVCLKNPSRIEFASLTPLDQLYGPAHIRGLVQAQRGAHRKGLSA